MSGNGTAVATREAGRSSLQVFLDKMQPKAVQALAGKMDPDAFMLGIETAIRKTPKLLQCSESSLFIAIATLAEAGLVPLYDLGYLIPRYNRDASTYEAHAQFGYKGLIDMLLRSGRVAGVDSEIVHEGDEFAYQRGLSPDIYHVPALSVGEKPVTHIYAIAWPTDPNAKPWFEVMTHAQVEHIRKVSADAKSPAWRNHWGQMARKTAIRRLCNYIPLRADDRKLLERDDEAAFDFDGHPEPIEGATRTERVEKMLAADDEPLDDEYLEGGVLELDSVEGELSIAKLEALAGIGVKDRDAIFERLGIEEAGDNPDAYAAELRGIIAARQEAEA